MRRRPERHWKRLHPGGGGVVGPAGAETWGNPGGSKWSDFGTEGGVGAGHNVSLQARSSIRGAALRKSRIQIQLLTHNFLCCGASATPSRHETMLERLHTRHLCVMTNASKTASCQFNSSPCLQSSAAAQGLPRRRRLAAASYVLGLPFCLSLRTGGAPVRECMGTLAWPVRPWFCHVA